MSDSKDKPEQEKPAHFDDVLKRMLGTKPHPKEPIRPLEKKK